MHESLAKVIDKQAFVLDATGGILRDAIIMASLGCRVWVCEAHPLIATLARDGLERALRKPRWAPIIGDENRFKFFASDSGLILEDFLNNNLVRPDIIYLDPMFPPKRKTSSAKKEIQWLQRIHANTDNMFPDFNPSTAEHIFALALKVARKRVIVKRPIHAQTLTPSPAVSFSKNFQTARFDVYLCA